MMLGALVDCGADRRALSELAREMGLGKVSFQRVEKRGLAAVKAKVEAAEEVGERKLDEVLDIVNRSPLSPQAKEKAKRVFRRLARAEAKVHGKSVKSIHFHEVGAADAILDVCLSCEAFLMLGGDKALVCASPVNVGRGFVKFHHGTYPVPAPATLELLKGVPLYSEGPERELCTPTGAALLREFVKEFRPFPPMVVHRIGHGAGEAELEIPNVLRLIIGEEWG